MGGVGAREEHDEDGEVEKEVDGEGEDEEDGGLCEDEDEDIEGADLALVFSGLGI